MLASSLSVLDITQEASQTLLDGPQSYLETIGPSDADRIRAILTPAYRKGFRVVFLVGASLCSFAFVVAWFMMPQVELSRPDDAKLKEEGRRMDEKKKGVV